MPAALLTAPLLDSDSCAAQDAADASNEWHPLHAQNMRNVACLCNCRKSLEEGFVGMPAHHALQLRVAQPHPPALVSALSLPCSEGLWNLGSGYSTAAQ